MSSSKLVFSDKPWSWSQDKLFDFLYLKGNIPYAFKEFFLREDIIQCIAKLSDFLYQEAQTKTIFPPMANVFKALHTINPRCLILGMDPYHNPGSAVGLCFSIHPHARLINPSFRSIQQEVRDCGFEVDETSGDITRWAREGVLLLNSALTVEKGDAGSHIEYWSGFTEQLLEYISEKYELCYLLWGRDAQAYKSSIKRPSKQYIIETSHPVSMAANMPAPIPFFGSRCFSKANAWLQKNKRNAIDWSIP